MALAELAIAQAIAWGERSIETFVETLQSNPDEMVRRNSVSCHSVSGPLLC